MAFIKTLFYLLTHKVEVPSPYTLPRTTANKPEGTPAKAPVGASIKK
jgi:hypothetical protein